MKLMKDRRFRPVTMRSIFPVSNSMLAGLALACVLFAWGEPAWAVAHAAIVVDAQTGAVLYSLHADTPAHPASLTKLMTLYITFEQLKSGRLTLDTELPVSSHAAAQQPVKLGLRPGSRITVRTAILGIVTISANDAAVVLAEGIAGSEPSFAVLMNRTAQKLGMKNTHYYNASGLPNAGQWTTARDMSTLALALIHNFPAYYHFFSVPSFRFDGRTLLSDDHLLRLFPGTDGLKTGYIRSSGYNLVTSVVRQHRRLVGVVLGGTTVYARDHLMMALLTRAFSNQPSPLLEARAVKKSAAPAPKAAALRLAGDETKPAKPGNPVPPEGRDWVVQVGRYFPNEQDVRRTLKSAALTVPALLRNGRELVVKLRGRRYLAQFTRLNEDMAASACGALSRKGFTCRFFSVPPSREDRAEASLSSRRHETQDPE